MGFKESLRPALARPATKRHHMRHAKAPSPSPRLRGARRRFASRGPCRGGRRRSHSEREASDRLDQRSARRPRCPEAPRRRADPARRPFLGQVSASHRLLPARPPPARDGGEHRLGHALLVDVAAPSRAHVASEPAPPPGAARPVRALRRRGIRSRQLAKLQLRRARRRPVSLAGRHAVSNRARSSAIRSVRRRSRSPRSTAETIVRTSDARSTGLNGLVM
jgi:hypothetical protein